MLYLTAGDATSPALAQDPASLAGKLLRYQPDGTIPIANPFPDSPVYALGLRNPQGLAWHPETRTPFVSEHGPSELSWESHSGWFGDELNAIVPGGNYGWPQVVGTGGPDQFIEPLVEWSPSIGPSAVTVYTGPHLPWQGNILVASLRGERLWRIVLERNETVPAGWDAIEREPMMEGRVGRIRAVAMGPDGHLYIATSNRDSRGQPREGDDQIYRVVP
jgi:glucose/arabinose dehydrogenase